MARAARSCCLTLLVALVLALTPTAWATPQVFVHEDAGTVAAMTGPQPDGVPGLTTADGLFQVGRGTVLPASRSVERVTAAELTGRSATAMEQVLFDRMRGAGGHLVIIDEAGPAFRGAEGYRLAAALNGLSTRTAGFAKGDLARRVHVYVQADATELSRPEYTGVRRAMSRAGGIWLKTFGARGPWTDEQWRTIPPLVARYAGLVGSSGRVHLVFGPGGQARSWRLAGMPGNCPVLLNGPGSYRVGADAFAFVAELRRVVGGPGFSGTATCPGPDDVPERIARALQSVVALERTGVELVPAPAFPPLVAGEPAQLALTFGPDPLGLAAALGLSPEAMWTQGGFRARVSGAGTSAEAPIDGDSTARLLLTPPSPGALEGAMVVEGATLLRILGPDADLLATLRRIGGDPTLLQRVAADPAGWSFTVPVRPSGTPAGSPLAEVVAAP